MRIAAPPMPMRDRLQLTYALITRHGGIHADPTAAALGVDWRPLLGYVGGNPAKIIGAGAQALREGLATNEQVAEFAEISALDRG